MWTQSPSKSAEKGRLIILVLAESRIFTKKRCSKLLNEYESRRFLRRIKFSIWWWNWIEKTSRWHYQNSKLCRVSDTLGKGYITLGKVFAECNTRQTTLGKGSHGKVDFAECRNTGTRQRFCRVPWYSAKKPRGATLVPRFAECLTADTRQSFKLCQVPAPGYLHVSGLPSVKAVALGKRSNLCRVPVL